MQQHAHISSKATPAMASPAIGNAVLDLQKPCDSRRRQTQWSHVLMWPTESRTTYL